MMRMDMGRYSSKFNGSNSNLDELEPPNINCQRFSDSHSTLYCAGALPVLRTEMEKNVEAPGWAWRPAVPAATT